MDGRMFWSRGRYVSSGDSRAGGAEHSTLRRETVEKLRGRFFARLNIQHSTSKYW
jgi:hypothetical protein